MSFEAQLRRVFAITPRSDRGAARRGSRRTCAAAQSDGGSDGNLPGRCGLAKTERQKGFRGRVPTASNPLQLDGPECRCTSCVPLGRRAESGDRRPPYPGLRFPPPDSGARPRLPTPRWASAFGPQAEVIGGAVLADVCSPSRRCGRSRRRPAPSLRMPGPPVPDPARVPRMPAPDFTLIDQAGNPWTLSAHRDAATLLVFLRGDW